MNAGKWRVLNGFGQWKCGWRTVQWINHAGPMFCNAMSCCVSVFRSVALCWYNVVKFGESVWAHWEDLFVILRCYHVLMVLMIRVRALDKGFAWALYSFSFIEGRLKKIWKPSCVFISDVTVCFHCMTWQCLGYKSVKTCQKDWLIKISRMFLFFCNFQICLCHFYFHLMETASNQWWPSLVSFFNITLLFHCITWQCLG